MRAGSVATFAIASALTAVGWRIAWPDTPAAAGPERPPISPAEARPVVPRVDPLPALLAAATDEERLAAALRLDGIPSDGIAAALASIDATHGGHLTFAAKALLIRWAADAPEAALAWAWENFRSLPAWQDALREIGPAWAWKDPRGFSDWAAAHYTRLESGLSVQVANDSEEPILEFDDLSRICTWTFKEDARSGMELFLKRGGFSSRDSNLWDSITDPRKLEHALLAFPPESFEKLAEQHRSNSYTIGPATWAQSLMQRWIELSPEDFKQSPYARFAGKSRFQVAADAAEDWRHLPPEDRAGSARQLLEEIDANLAASAAFNIAKHWAAEDPAACREWLESLPEDTGWFAAGEFISIRAAEELDDALDWIQRFPPDKQAALFVRAFDAWTEARPGGVPDVSGWGDERRSAWEDLEALRNLERR